MDSRPVERHQLIAHVDIVTVASTLLAIEFDFHIDQRAYMETVKASVTSAVTASNVTILRREIGDQLPHLM